MCAICARLQLKDARMYLVGAQSGGAVLQGAAAAVECCREGQPPMRVQCGSYS